MSVARLTTGALFAGRFRIERVIGRGGMGTVHEVVEDATGERFALKVLAPQLVSDPKHRARFAQEATISAEIRSAHVVPVVDAGVDEETDTPWLTMELLRGESLKAFVRTHGKLDAKVAADVLGQVADGLAAAHAAGVVHRDLKPDNVFVVRTPDGALDVRVLDFGIAKIASETLGRTTGAMGSPLWMAPEEAKKEPLTPAVDVWAFGLLAFYVLTGSALWRSAAKGSNIAEALHEVLIEPIPNPILRAHAAGVALPRGFDEWFAGCVVRDVSLRFPDVAGAWGHLETILRSPPRPPSPVPPPPEPVTPPSPMSASTRKWLVVAGSVAVSAGVFALVVTSFGGDREPVAQTNGTAVSTTPTSSPAPEESVLFAPLPVAPLPLAPAPVRDAAAREPALTAPRASSLPPVQPNGSVADRARALLMSDSAAARALLEPRVFGRKATDEEATMLYGICKVQHDTTCKNTIKEHYPNVR